jgi:DNA polymerase sigma
MPQQNNNNSIKPNLVYNFRPKGEMIVCWSLPKAYVVKHSPFYTGNPSDHRQNLRSLLLGLYRRGVGSNSNAIITKDVLSYNITQDSTSYKGTVSYYAPRSPGCFIFRLFYDTSTTAVYQLGTSRPVNVLVQGKDLEPNLRFVLSQFKTKKTAGMALHQLGEVLAGLAPDSNTRNNGGGRGNGGQQNNNDNVRNDGAGRAAWGCICEGRKVLESAETDLKECLVNIENIESLSAASDKADDAAVDNSAKESLYEKKRMLERKFKEVVVSLSEVLHACLFNKTAFNLFRGEQIDVIRGIYDRYDTLTESFCDESVILAEYQRTKLGFVPSRKLIVSVDQYVFESIATQCKTNYTNVCPSKDFGQIRETVRERLMVAISSIPDVLPQGTSILIFGSSGNGFGSDKSDLDMCLALPEGITLEDPPGAMGKLAELLESIGMEDVNPRLTARIPIVMFKDNVSGLECDISMQNPLAVKNTKLLGLYARCDPRVRMMAYAIKRWSKARNLNSPSNGTLSSYGWILMLLHFLMRVRVIPNLQAMPPNWDGISEPQDPGATGGGTSTASGGKEDIVHPTEPDFVVNGYIYTPRNNAEGELLLGYCRRNSMSVGYLLASFFSYYNDFDYKKYVVSLGGGRGVPLLEKNAMGEEHCWPTHNGLAIQDPFEYFYNVAHVVKNNGFATIREEISRAYTLIADGDGVDVLDKICEEVKEVMEAKEAAAKTAAEEGEGGGGGDEARKSA